MARPTREIPLRLDPETYDRLAAQAREYDRDPWQQARYIIRSHLGSTGGEPTVPSVPAPPSDTIEGRR